MLGTKRLSEFELRKQALLLESNLNRLALRVEFQHLCRAGAWMDRLGGVRSVIKPWALPLAPLAGIAVALRRRGRFGWLGRLTKAVVVLTPLIKLWRARIAQSKE